MFLNDLVDPTASLTLLSELMNYDFSSIPLDAPITDELIASVSGIRGLVQNLRDHIGGTVTLADLAGHRATLLQGPRFVGTGPEVADQMEEWFDRPSLRRVRHRRHPLPGRLRGRRPAGGSRAAAPRGVPRPLHRFHLARPPGPAPSGTAAQPAMPDQVPGPLAGLRVIDAATLAAGTAGRPPSWVSSGPRSSRWSSPGPVIRCGPGASGKDGIGLVWKSMSRNKRCVTLDLRQARGAGAPPPTARCQRRAHRRQPAERAGPLGHRLRVGPPSPPEDRHAPRQRVREGWSGQ